MIWPIDDPAGTHPSDAADEYPGPDDGFFGVEDDWRDGIDPTEGAAVGGRLDDIGRAWPRRAPRADMWIDRGTDFDGPEWPF